MESGRAIMAEALLLSREHSDGREAKPPHPQLIGSKNRHLSHCTISLLTLESRGQNI